MVHLFSLVLFELGQKRVDENTKDQSAGDRSDHDLTDLHGHAADTDDTLDPVSVIEHKSDVLFVYIHHYLYRIVDRIHQSRSEVRNCVFPIFWDHVGKAHHLENL